MTFYNDSAVEVSDHKEIFNRVVDYAIGAGALWTEVMAREDFTPPITGNTERRCVLRTAGLDADHQIYLQLQTDSDPQYGVYGLMVRIIFSYDSGKDWDSQEMKGLENSWSCVPLFNANMKTWISVTSTRLNMVVSINGIAHPFTMGTHLTNVGIDEYAYPAFIGAAYISDGEFSVGAVENSHNSGAEGVRYDFNSTIMSNFTFGNTPTTSTGGYSDSVVVRQDNLVYQVAIGGTTGGSHYYSPHYDFFSFTERNIGGGYTIYPIVLMALGSSVGINLTLDGWGRVGGYGTLSNEDTVTVSGVVHHVFQHSQRSGENSFFTMEAI